MVKLLLNAGQMLIRLINMDGRTPVHCAQKEDHSDVVKVFILYN